MNAPDIEKNYQIYVYMGCPSNVRLYTSYYNNFIMADLLNALSFSHLMTVIVHAVSFGYAYHFMDKVPDSEKYSLNTITQLSTTEVDAVLNATTNETITPAVPSIKYAEPMPVTEGIFYMMNPMAIIMIMNIIVFLTMLVHLTRRAFNVASMAYKSIIMQALHIAAYGISHFLAIFLIALIAGVRNDVAFVVIFVSVLSLEGLQHLSANPAPPALDRLTGASAGLVGLFAGLPTLIAVILIGDALVKQDIENSGLAFAALIVLEGVKFLTEAASFLLEPLPFIGELYREGFDSRVAHSVYDALVKVFVVWFILLEKLEKSGGIDGETDLSTAGSAAIGWSGVGIFAVYLLYSLAAPRFGLPRLASPGISKDEFPAGTMEEKSRMLQVA